MNLEAARTEVNTLSEKLRYYNKRYYQDSVSEISDYEFDQLLEKLIALETKFPELLKDDSPSQRVGGTIIIRYWKISFINARCVAWSVSL